MPNKQCEIEKCKSTGGWEMRGPYITDKRVVVEPYPKCKQPTAESSSSGKSP